MYISLLQTVGVGPGVVVPPRLSSVSSSSSTSISSTVIVSLLITLSISGFGAERDKEWGAESVKWDWEELKDDKPCDWSVDK